MGNRDGADRRGKGRWQGFDLGGGSGQSGRNPWRFLILYIVVGVLLLALLRSLASPGPSKAQLSDFYTQLARHEVQTVTITGSSVDWTTSQNGRFSATLPPNFDSSTLVKQLQDEHVPQFKGEQPSAIAALLFQWILPFAVLALIWVFLIRRMAGGGAASALNLGKNRVKIYDRKEMKTTFSDVAGLDEAVEELKEIVEFLRNPRKNQRLGGRIPKGVPVAAPPRCGE